EPFRGVDLGARADIAAKIREQAGAVIVASADVDEVLEVADRIVVLSHGAVSEPAFRSVDNIISILQSVSTVGIIALGVTVSMVVGGFDLSIGANAGFTVMLCAIGLVIWGLPTVAIVPIALASGLLIGALNGLLIVRLQVPDLLATLGM